MNQGFINVLCFSFITTCVLLSTPMFAIAILAGKFEVVVMPMLLIFGSLAYLAMDLLKRKP